MGKFNLKLVDPIELQRVEKNGVRFYRLPDGSEVPSVTTVLQKLSEAGIAAWKERVGHVEAAAIARRAADRGTIIHSLCENYLKSVPNYLKGISPFDRSSFFAIKPFLDKHVTDIYGIEARLYSKSLRTAGTTDLICLWDGIPTVVDFKTSKKVKQERYLTGYQFQGTIYSLMANQMYNFGIKQFVILIASDDQDLASVYHYPVDKYRREAVSFFENHGFC